jgi:hypothetical protein
MAKSVRFRRLSGRWRRLRLVHVRCSSVHKVPRQRRGGVVLLGALLRRQGGMHIRYGECGAQRHLSGRSRRFALRRADRRVVRLARRHLTPRSLPPDVLRVRVQLSSV